MKKFSEIIRENILFDSHAHIGIDNAIPIEEQLLNAEKAGVKYIFNMGTKPEDWEGVLNLGKSQYSSTRILPCLGIHPEEVDEADFKKVEGIKKHRDEIFMIGEIGLDYYWRDDNKQKQREVFRIQLEIAKELGLPASVHVRDKDGSAYNDAFSIINEIGSNNGIVLHSYTSDYSNLKRAVDLGYFIGVNGIITYSKAEDLREALRKYLSGIGGLDPVDFYSKHILFETDAPLLRPSNAVLDGKGNQPANVVKVYEALCRLVRKSHQIL